MRISVNIRHIQDHINLLHHQQREAEALVDCVIALCEQSVALGIPDVAIAQRQLETARKQVDHIRRRVTLLESMLENFSILTQTVHDILTDALDVSHSLDF